MNERIIELAKKLKALAEQGVGGEKQNAITMLEAMMKKHGITMDMINDNQAKKHYFIISNQEIAKRFFRQVIANIMGKEKNWVTYVRHPRGKERYGVECTPAEAIEIQARFDFFWRIFDNEFDIFYSAFIQKNQLYQRVSEDEQRKKYEELTPEEAAKLEKILSMMRAMERHIFTKQIGHDKKQ